MTISVWLVCLGSHCGLCWVSLLICNEGMDAFDLIQDSKEDDPA